VIGSNLKILFSYGQKWTTGTGKQYSAGHLFYIDHEILPSGLYGVVTAFHHRLYAVHDAPHLLHQSTCSNIVRLAYGVLVQSAQVRPAFTHADRRQCVVFISVNSWPALTTNKVTGLTQGDGQKCC